MSVGNSRYLKIGPGGRRCNCCFPAPGSKDRRAEFRSAKRRAEREAMRFANVDINDDELLLREIEADNQAEFEAANDYDLDAFDDFIDDDCPDEPEEIYHHDDFEYEGW